MNLIERDSNNYKRGAQLQLQQKLQLQLNARPNKMPVDCKRVACGGVASSMGKSRAGVPVQEVAAPTKPVAPHRGFVPTKK